MNSIKCPSCRLVNFATAEICKRCQHDLTINPALPAPIPPPQFSQPIQPVIQCPFCKSTAGIVTQNKTTTGGMIVFIVLLLFLCLPLCWIGLLIKETRTFCVTCRMKLS